MGRGLQSSYMTGLRGANPPPPPPPKKKGMPKVGGPLAQMAHTVPPPLSSVNWALVYRTFGQQGCNHSYVYLPSLCHLSKLFPDRVTDPNSSLGIGSMPIIHFPRVVRVGRRGLEERAGPRRRWCPVMSA